MKRVSYAKVQIPVLTGMVEIVPSTDGWSVRFSQAAEQPRIGYGKTIDEAGQSLVKDLRSLVNAIEEDLNAFVERNK